ncbi:hypothetical protein JOF41_003587 [Saccharothrix coeruleofusca]|uniref:hypothetical protein n=1 Tax=Saccharothrix coeruleofusca TaxID=33919 RepID=UPI001AE1F9FA|nr:hypothetical protein [Saccharothrix coeruleofusca]MBP2337409.1 hypothetical protein [Saccharothrix coeruleofusca]
MVRVFVDLRAFLPWVDDHLAVAGCPEQPDLARLTADDLADTAAGWLGLPIAGARNHTRRTVRLLGGADLA